jgi:hypothetical protein
LGHGRAIGGFRSRRKACQRLAEFLFGARLPRAFPAEPRRHDPDVDLAERRLLIDHGLRRRSDARDDIVRPGEGPQQDAAAIQFGFVDALNGLVEQRALLGTIAGGGDEDANLPH